MTTIKIKRVYLPADPTDGYRVLVDRLWPRGIKKEKAAIDIWLKEAGPSNELRTWFHHEVEKWDEFVKKYQEELKSNPVVDDLKNILKAHKTVTLVYSAKDEAHNQALALMNFLKN